MADPVTLAGMSIGSSVAGAGLGFMGSMQKGKAQSQAYQYQAGIARANQRIQEQNVDWTLQSGERDAVSLGLKQRAERGQLMDKQLASGLKIGVGSNADTLTGLDTVQQYDRETQQRNLLQKVRGYKLAAWEQGEQANIYDSAAKNAKKAGTIDAIRSLVGGAESVSDKWLKAKNAGIY